MYKDTIVARQIILVKRDSLCPGQAYIPRKPRDHHALAYITEGRLRYIRNGTAVELNTNEIIFIQAGCLDYSECIGNTPVSYITVDFTADSDSYDWPIRYSGGMSSRNLCEIFGRILECYTLRADGWEMDSIELLYSILNNLRRFESGKAYQYRRILPALEILDKQLADTTLSASVLADACDMSVGSLNRIIHSLYGCSTSSLLQTRRIEHACYLLNNSTSSITDIAVRCGFADIYTFSHAFKRAMGCAPSEWCR